MADSQDNIPEEIWKEIPGFPGYKVSNQGRVRSYWTKGPGSKPIINSQRFLRPFNNGGYMMVSLRKDRKPILRAVHQIMLLAFKGSCPPVHESCHNDGNPSHNVIENLRWDTRSANSQDSIRHGSHAGLKRKGINHPGVKLTESQVVQIRELYAQGHSQTNLSKMFGITFQTIWEIVHRKIWKHLP